uniref:hypothetical protein n=1 Tax=Sphingomonas bacterium TaxID=1895847 RepID=UPI00260EBA3E|nr:hypothetical protein [Sphingomonas bacterium]
MIDQIEARSREFDPLKHSFNPLHKIDHRRARDLARILYAADPGGDTTLTTRNGRRALARLLLTATSLDTIHGDTKDPGEAEAQALLDNVLFSPVVRSVLCEPANFALTGTILARLNRAELGDEDCYVMGNLLASLYRGTVVIPDLGFYAHPGHRTLIRQDRLIAGVNSLDELPEFRSQLLTITRKEGSHCTWRDAEELAGYAGLRPDPARVNNEYNRFVDAAIA